MKHLTKYILHKILGFKNYLYFFAIFKIRTLRSDKKEGDFFKFLDLVKDQGIVLDIGANIGIMTYHLSRRFKQSTIIAFEPMPMNISTLERIISKFKLKNVKLLKVALGNEKGEVEMVMPVEKNVKMQGLSHVVHDSITEFNEGITVKTPLEKLDEVEAIRVLDLPINGIKMDVENFEYFVLDGGRSLIKKYRPIIYTELWENENRDKCFGFAQELNYRVQMVENGVLRDFDPKKDKTQNFIFTPAE